MGLTDHVHHALNGREALDYLTLKGAAFADYRRPDLILLDINMPIMNGFEFLDEYEKLPAEEKGHHLIVMLTTSMLEVDKERAAKFGVLSEYIAKPLTEVQLARVIQKIGGD
jgi:CheY-like chemotaxis protein